jgi:serine/threonine-protein phosphatase 2B regulatory subunit
MDKSPYPLEWYEEAFIIPGIDQGAFTDQSAEDIFSEFDTDNKGFLIRSDIRRMMNNIGEAANEDDLDSIMKLLDPDGTGAVTIEQFIDFFMSPTPLFQNPDVAPGSNATLPVRRTQRRPETLSPVDDIDTELNRANNERKMLFLEVMSSGKLKSSDIRLIFNRFKAVDTEGKGKLSYEQFLEGMGRTDSVSSRRMFDLCDKDGSGELELREFVLGLVNLTDTTRDDRVQFAFKLFDTDSSGYIDRTELTSIVKSACPASALPAWIRKRVDELYESINLPKGALIDLPTFETLAHKNPKLITPAIESIQ